MHYSNRGLHQVPLHFTLQAHQNWTISGCKNVPWSDESWFQLQYSELAIQSASLTSSARLSCIASKLSLETGFRKHWFLFHPSAASGGKGWEVTEFRFHPTISTYSQRDKKVKEKKCEEKQTKPPEELREISLFSLIKINVFPPEPWSITLSHQLQLETQHTDAAVTSVSCPPVLFPSRFLSSEPNKDGGS